MPSGAGDPLAERTIGGWRGTVAATRFVAQQGLEWITGNAAIAYGDKLKKYLRHVVFVKPDVVLLGDVVEPRQPSVFQWMLHRQAPFTVDGQQLRLERSRAGVLVDYIAAEPLTIRQWDGYDPPGSGKAANVARAFPNQWHVEAAAPRPTERALTVTVLRVYRPGRAPYDVVKAVSTRPGFGVIRKNGRTWRLHR